MKANPEKFLAIAIGSLHTRLRHQCRYRTLWHTFIDIFPSTKIYTNFYTLFPFR
jgi:hypothetical protein